MHVLRDPPGGRGDALGYPDRIRGTRHRAAWSAAVAFSAAAFGLICAGNAAAQDDNSINLEELKKKPYALNGFLELNANHQELNQDGGFFKLAYLQDPRRASIDQSSLALQLEGDYAKDLLQLHFRVNNTVTQDYTGTSTNSVWQEAYAAVQPGPSLTVDAGKRVTKWGKGYGFNPVAFVDRPKDPNDPDLTQEGFVMVRAETIRSFEGALRNAAFTLVLLPVQQKINNDFGPIQDQPVTNVAGKLYLLAWDTDFDLVALADGTRSSRYGFDFSRNLKTNFEIHGEWAAVSSLSQPVLQAQDVGTSTQAATVTRLGEAESWLLGLRYLTEGNLTAIAEYYYNGGGYSADEQSAYFRFVDQGYQRFLATGNTSSLQLAQNLQQGAYGRPNPGRSYAYLRLSQKNAFGWLYFTPGLIEIENADDQSSMTTVEALYTGVTNLELRFRYTALQGARFTEFAEKQVQNKTELRVRYFF